MKKILSFFTAGLLALGLIGCSGDLHDKELGNPLNIDGYWLVGTMTNNWDANAATQITKDADYKYNVIFEATSADNEQFAFIQNAGSWDGQIGGDQIVAGTGSDEGISYEQKDNGFGGFNAIFKGLVVGKTYKITIDSSSGQVAVIANVQADPIIPVPYTLDGIYLVGGVFASGNIVLNNGVYEAAENGWNFGANNLVSGAKVETKTGIVTYQMQITATAASGELGLNDSSWNNKLAVKETPVPADGKAYVITGDGEKGNFAVSGLKIGNPYFVIITTTPEKEISVTIKEANYIRILGVQIVNLPEADYKANSTFAFGGDQIGWDGKRSDFPNWDAANGTVDANGTVTYALPEAVKLFSNNVKISILAKPSTGWEKRIAAVYQDDKGNGSIDISDIDLDFTDYIIYADVDGLAAGDEVEWKLIHPTYEIEATGLPAAANGKKVFFTGNYNTWTKPGDAGTVEATIASGAVSTVISLPTVDGKLNVEGKFAAAGWSTPEVAGAAKADGNVDNAKFSVTSWPQKITATYVSTPTEDKYACTWTVE